MLYEHYGDKVSITSIKQQPLAVTLSSNIKQLVRDAHKKLAEWDDMDVLIEIVGDYIKNEIKSAEKHKDVYPGAEEIVFKPQSWNFACFASQAFNNIY